MEMSMKSWIPKQISCIHQHAFSSSQNICVNDMSISVHNAAIKSIFPAKYSIDTWKYGFITRKWAHCLSDSNTAKRLSVCSDGYCRWKIEKKCKKIRTKKIRENVHQTNVCRSWHMLWLWMWMWSVAASIEYLRKLLTFLAFVVEVCFYPSLRVNNEPFGDIFSEFKLLMWAREHVMLKCIQCKTVT